MLTQNILKQINDKGIKIKIEYDEEKNNYEINGKWMWLNVLMERRDYNKTAFLTGLVEFLTEDELLTKYEKKIEKLIKKYETEYDEILTKYNTEIMENGLSNIVIEYNKRNNVTD